MLDQSGASACNKLTSGSTKRGKMPPPQISTKPTLTPTKKVLRVPLDAYATVFLRSDPRNAEKKAESASTLEIETYFSDLNKLDVID